MTVRRVRAVCTVAISAMAIVVALFASAMPASAHAMMVATSPADRESLRTAPSEAVVTFDEPVVAGSDAVRVFDSDARRVDTGPVDVADDEVAAGLPADLPDGGYVAVYRVTSTDSHPIGGVVSFTVGDAAAVDDEVVAQLFGGGAGGVTGLLGTLSRAIGYAATLLAAGAVAFAWRVAVHAGDRERARRLARRSAIVGVVVTLLSVPVQGMAVSGTGVAAAFDPTVLGEVMVSSFGVSAAVRVVALAALALSWRAESGWLLPGLAGLVAAGSFVLDGHQRSVDPTWLLVGGGLVHLFAAAFWLAGLVLVAAAVRRPARDDAVASARLVRGFSSGALIAVLALTVAGFAMSWPLVRSWSALVSTDYGWTLVVKLLLVGLVVAVAVYNRQRLVPAISSVLVPAGGSVDAPAPTASRDAVRRQAWQRLRTTLVIEATIVVAVLGVTAVLVGQRPAAEAAGLAGLYEASAPLGDDLRVDLVVDPNRAGVNSIHLYVLDGTGRPTTTVDDLRIELTYLPQQIGPIPLDVFAAGPGHWTTSGGELAFPGDWEIRVVAGVDRFTELSTSLVVPVAASNG